MGEDVKLKTRKTRKIKRKYQKQSINKIPIIYKNAEVNNLTKNPAYSKV